jgi:hypothetical protein
VNVEEVIAEIEEFTKEYAAKLGVPYEDDMVSLPHLSCFSSLFLLSYYHWQLFTVVTTIYMLGIFFKFPLLEG